MSRRSRRLRRRRTARDDTGATNARVAFDNPAATKQTRANPRLLEASRSGFEKYKWWFVLLIYMAIVYAETGCEPGAAFEYVMTDILELLVEIAIDAIFDS